MATKQKYEVLFNKRRKKYEVFKAGIKILSSDTEEKAIYLMHVFKNYPFVSIIEPKEVVE